MNTKVRLVKCPRCRNLLPELPDLPVYKCGGCGIILQAKNRKTESNDSGLHIKKTDTTLKDNQNFVEQDREISTSSEDATLPCRRESYLDQFHNVIQDRNAECSKEQSPDAISSNGTSLSLACNSHEIEGLTLDVGEAVEQEKGNYSLDQKTDGDENERPSPKAREHKESGKDDCQFDKCTTKNQNECGNCKRETPEENDLPDKVLLLNEARNHENFSGKTNFSCELPPIEQYFHENGLSSPKFREHKELETEICRFDKCTRKDQNGRSDCQREKPESNNHSLPEKVTRLDEVKDYTDDNGNSHFFSKCPVSSEQDVQENEPLSPKFREHVQSDKDKCQLEQCTLKDKNERIDLQKENSEDKNLFDRVYSSNETKHRPNDYRDGNFSNGHSMSIEPKFHNCEYPLTKVREHVVSGKEIYKLDHGSTMDQNECGDCKKEAPGNDLLCKTPLSEVRHHTGIPSLEDGADGGRNVNKYLSMENNERVKDNLQGQNGDIPLNASCSAEASTYFEAAFQERSSSLAGENRKYEGFESRGAGISLETKTQDSIVAMPSLLNERFLSGNHMSPDHDQLEHSHERFRGGFVRISSDDTLDSMPLVYPNSQLGVRHRPLSKSPTKIYYSHNGSESSYDGDDHLTNQFSQLARRKFKDVDYRTNGLHRNDRLRANNVLRNESELQHSAVLPRRSYQTFRGSNWDHEESLEPRRQGHSARNWTRTNKDESVSRLQFISADSHFNHRNGSPSKYGQNEFQRHPDMYSSNMSSYSEQEKMELLRMVYQLNDQLNRTYISRGMTDRTASAGTLREEKPMSMYHDHLAPREDIYGDLNQTGPRRYHQGSVWPQQPKSSRNFFSGETSHCRHHVNCSCLYCHPQDQYCSPEFPSCSHHCQGSHIAHPSHNCLNYVFSSSSSPLHHVSSEFSVCGRATRSDDLRPIARDKKILHLRETHRLHKRHLLPVAGGAPILACYHCSELLQLPADFLLSKRRFHRLKCNACNNILRFSLSDGTHVVPHVPGAIAPSQSEIDDYRSAIDQMHQPLASESYPSPHAELVSCSDDYGASFCRSSTEGEPSGFRPLLQGPEPNTYNRKVTFRGSPEPSEDRKMKSVLIHSESKHKKSLGLQAKIPKGGKPSSESEELPSAKCSPLHRLMGYSSLSQVLRD